MAGALQLKQMFAQDSSLRPADVKLLAVAQSDDVSPTRHRVNAANHFDIDQRSAPESHEMSRIEAGFQILEPIRDRVGFVPRRRQMEQLSVGDDGGDLSDRQDDDLVLMAHRDAFEDRWANDRLVIFGRGGDARGGFDAQLSALQTFLRAIDGFA